MLLMARKTKYDSRGIAHIYQRGFNMSVIFYSVKDILVFYTILYVLKKKYKITVLGIVFMYNHYHLLIKARSQEVVSCFMRDLETVFSKEFNKEAGIKGKLPLIFIIIRLRNNCQPGQWNLDGTFWPMRFQTTPFQKNWLSEKLQRILKNAFRKSGSCSITGPFSITRYWRIALKDSHGMRSTNSLTSS